MAFQEDPPFLRGKTRFEGVPPDATSEGGFEGKEFWFPDTDWGNASEVKPARSSRMVKVRAVRNVSGGAILPKQLCRLKTTGTAYEFEGQIVNNTPTVGDRCYPADEFLPAAGVVNNDIFYVVVEGPAKVTSDSSGTTTVGIGAYVVPGTVVAGSVVAQNTGVAAGSATFNQIQGAVGPAITACGAVSTDFLIDVLKK